MSGKKEQQPQKPRGGGVKSLGVVLWYHRMATTWGWGLVEGGRQEGRGDFTLKEHLKMSICSVDKR